MSQISVKNLTFCYEGSFDNIFENVSFSVDTNWKLGFIGRNGKGKTTFLKLLTGEYQYSGSIDSSVAFGYFPYVLSDEQMQLSAAELLDEMKSGCELWRVICELSLLREESDILFRPFVSLSPGERTKVMLAVLFSGENDFLLIDEPTNHLDNNAREAVRDYLSDKKGFILVSHDRELLDACTDHVLVLNRKSVEVQNGNFSVWWEKKEKRDHFAAAENEKHKKEIKKLKQAAKRVSDWADKNESTKIGFDPVKEHDRCISTRSFIGAKTKKMQSHVKQMEKRISREIEEKEGLLNDIERAPELKIQQLQHHRSTLVEVRDYCVQYETADTPLFTGLTFTVKKGDRIALHGGNGCGKSTLIKCLLDKAGYNIAPLPIKETGLCETASGLIISYVSQNTDGLNGSLQDFCMSKEVEQSLFFSVLRQLDFERTQFTKDIRDLSAGQKKKVLIAASLLSPSHLFIWDEPLNYIDVFSRMQIEKLISTYQPTMIFVEHDTRFREKIATSVIELDQI
ncbi:ribosomal protection-like ABC-F family protein [Ruminococcus sp. XPD3002]|uniref:ribosomal protection-like ABC-F family protein n=1 Tax=Ruminococcus sp. XPD3002 TaxID=1452269 RepID=UPI000913D92F|nr:lincosamide and streptogramin A transport system ATP-binding/permease protein [Ruminococcus flavefaciens]